MPMIEVILSDEVEVALAARRPIVAVEWAKEKRLEVRAGQPFQSRLEAAVRSRGAVPASIAIIDGRIRIGLNESERATLAETKLAKLTEANLAHGLATRATGAPTAGATMMLAQRAGIPILCTGGIGGVHRGYDRLLDVSADLEILGKTPICVVCSGAKAILDLPNTLEYLETRGVPLVAFGGPALPAFWSRSSPWKAPLSIDDPVLLARMLALHLALGAGTGMVVANPVPAVAAVAWEQVDDAVRQAVAEAERQGITGPGVTPFLIDRVDAATDGATTRAAEALLIANAELAGLLAVELSRL